MLTDPKREPRILIIDDHDAGVRALEELLARAGYSQCFSTGDPREALAMFPELSPDIVLLDLWLDGYSVLGSLKEAIPADAFLPILVLAAAAPPEAKQNALSLGATDFVKKPVDAADLVLRIRNLLRARFMYLELNGHNSAELQHAQIEMLERLAIASELRDDHTGDHTKRVGMLAAMLGLHAGWPSASIDELRRAASLHDIGKIAIPDRILLKPGRLDPKEFATMKTHT